MPENNRPSLDDIFKADNRPHLDTIFKAPPQAPQGPQDASQQAPPSEPPSQLQSGLMGAAKGLTLGAAPTLQAAVGVGKDVVQGNTPMDWEAIKQHYLSKLSEQQRDYNAAQQANPKTFLAGELAGGAALPIPGSLAGRVAQGAVMGLQSANGSLLDKPIDQAVGAGIGAATGGVLGTATKLLNPGQTAEGVQDAAAVAMHAAHVPYVARTATHAVIDKVSDLLNNAPHKLGPFLPVLQQSAQRGTLPVTTYLLNQSSSQFRQTMDGDVDSDERTAHELK